ncbi:immune inhibitor A domain-containing protein [Microbacterium karelineae]|uniref:immune inhibitor A domain-containing protein n=1 Tax=Microbacterium karelineae TaxID=2654283 RepID=UPI0012EA1671|nr:immune inhibitor A domain-containing protein [Microbacterium karelineae]
MKIRTTCALGAAALLAGSLLVPSAATAAPAPNMPDEQSAAPADNRPDPLAEKRSAEKQKAAEAVALGDAEVSDRGRGSQKSKVVELKPGEYVEYGTAETAELFTILVEFGDAADERFPDAPVGPRHNEIPEPGPSDNSTYWLSDFSKAHYEDMFFGEGESMAGVYDEMSSGRFDLVGGVSDWVQVENNEASYGGTESQADMTRFVQDTANAWYDAQIAAGRTQDDIVAELQSYDVWDRYDADGDGIINEPDGYIDHFQAVHAGEGEEAGAPEWAIWSHRWAAGQAGLGVEGPSDYLPLGGVQIGDSDIWIRDYTTEPENGGLGVFAHEFGHDLGLPDFYDTEGGDNGTAYWTLMSSGSWLGHGDGDIGTTPNHMGPHEKLFLGWLDYEIVDAGADGSVDLGPSFHASTRGAQAAIVGLPDAETHIEVGAPASGSEHLYSGSGNDLDVTATSPEFVVPDGGELTASASYDIEIDWDYAFLEATTDGGSTWTPVETNLSTSTDPNGQNAGFGITGASDGWTALTADLSALAGETAQVRFRYWTDVAEMRSGFQVDEIAVGDALTTDDGASDWTLAGFERVVDGSYAQPYSHFYMVENRVYGGYDRVLETGPYNFGWSQSSPDEVEHYPFQDGMLVWYVSTLYEDNNTSLHPGGGEALPVDANAAALTWSDGEVARNRIQSFDATFSRKKTDAISLHRETADGAATLEVPSRTGIATFDDTDPHAYYDEANPWGSVIVGGTGTSVSIAKQNANKGTMTIDVRRAGELPTPDAWSATATYTGGEIVTFDGSEWLATWYAHGDEPGDVNGPWQELGTENADGVPAWTESRIFNTGDVVTFDGAEFEAKWWTRGQEPGDAHGPWAPVG